MGSLAAWVLAMVGPIAMRVLSALGIGWLTFEGVSVLADAAVASAQGAWGGLSGAVLAMAGLVGLSDALGIMCGGLVARVALVSVKGFLGKVSSG